MIIIILRLSNVVLAENSRVNTQLFICIEMIYGELPPLLYLATATTGPPRIRAFSRWVLYCYDDAQRRCLRDAAQAWNARRKQGVVLQRWQRWREWARQQVEPPPRSTASTPSTRGAAAASLPSNMSKEVEEELVRRCAALQLSDGSSRSSPSAAADGGGALSMARRMLRDRERRHSPARVLEPPGPQAALLRPGPTPASSQDRFAKDPAHRQVSLRADNDARRQRQLLQQQQAARREAQISEAECAERAKRKAARWQRLMAAREEARKRGHSREVERRRPKALRLLRELVAREVRPNRPHGTRRLATAMPSPQDGVARVPTALGECTHMRR